MSSRLPPQAPSSRPPSNRGSVGNPIVEDEKRSSGSSSRKSRRSSSDGVRIMQESYNQQQAALQQQYYYQQTGGNGGHPMQQYPQQFSNQQQEYAGLVQPVNNNIRQTPGRTHSDRSPRNSFDAGALGGGPFGSDPGANYGSIPPRPRTSSKEFSAMNELTSVIGQSPRNSGRKVAGGGPPRGGHRRHASDSLVSNAAAYGVPPPPPMMDAYGPRPSRGRADSHGSHASQHSQQRGRKSSRDVAEMQALLSQHGSQGGGANGTGRLARQGSYSGGRPKTHMRQNSVNLYMKTYKGEVQRERSCNDVLFGVLFFLQLAAMAAIGARFGPGALVENEDQLGSDEGLREDDAFASTPPGTSASHVVLAYSNVVKMAALCGSFAVVVSALALSFMMAMSRRLVYVALVLSIGVSFAWGTIGIGISPRSFVPVTGIIALMLTVG